MGDSYETQEKILASALKLFARKGYHGTTTSEIAKDCGVAEGTVFKYYKTKKILLDSVLHKIVNEIIPGIAFSTKPDLTRFRDMESGRAYVKEVLLGKIRELEANFDAFRVLVVEIQYHEDLLENYKNKVVFNLIDMLEKMYIVGMAKGIFRNLDAHVVARSFLGSMATLMLETYVLKRNNDVERDLDAILDIYLNGFAMRKEG